MSELTKRITIGAPVDKVWEVLADFGDVAKWAPTIVNSRSTTEANQGVGAKRQGLFSFYVQRRVSVSVTA